MVREMLILGIKSEHGNMNGSVDRPPLHHRRVALVGRLMQNQNPLIRTASIGPQ